MHADQHSANMKTKIKYWKIFNYRLNELTDNVDSKNANGIYAVCYEGNVDFNPILIDYNLF